MGIDRRHFIKGIVGSVATIFATIAAMSYAPRTETTEERINRLFSKCNRPKLCQALPLPLAQPSLRLRQSKHHLSTLTDKAFLVSLDENIRLDFAHGDITALEGWQLSNTEVAIMKLLSIERT